MQGWIGVDLDGTLAHYDGWHGPLHVGDPVPLMLVRVKQWIAEGKTVKIFTARCSAPEQIPPIVAWLELHGIGGLEITNVKDFAMLELWDDRAVSVIPNSGIPRMGTLDSRPFSTDEFIAIAREVYKEDHFHPLDEVWCNLCWLQRFGQAIERAHGIAPI